MYFSDGKLTDQITLWVNSIEVTNLLKAFMRGSTIIKGARPLIGLPLLLGIW
jgi:hypothetical protein